ncbi:gamma-glutamylcyclotransferase family protein [Tsuneonella sp. HG249]
MPFIRPLLPILFSYGTLQQPEVQLGTFGRLIEGVEDTLMGYILAPLHVSDAGVIDLSGLDVHLIARRSSAGANAIKGYAFEVTEEDLAKADAYEVDVYARVEEILGSGRRAFVYVGAPTAETSDRSDRKPRETPTPVT